jgi:dTDP-4-dehydrorhamnose 3,5-epimerase
MFARTFCSREFADHGLESVFVQCSVSFNRREGTLRGLHSQRPPHEEAKLIRCVRGSIFDVALDLRPGSPTLLRHVAVELTAANRRALYVPQGVYHGFQTLEDETEVLYQMSTDHAPDHGAGVRWDDPSFGIDWPLPVRVISARDASYPDHPAP